MKKSCPNCGVIYDWYVAECPTCHVALADQVDGENDENEQNDENEPDNEPDRGQAVPDASFVVVFSTTDPGLAPLAEMALDQAGIEYAIQNGGISDLISDGGVALRQEKVGTPMELVVRAEDEDRARELLDDLSAADAATAPAIPVTPSSDAASAAAPSRGAIHLVDAATGRPIGEISDAQFQFLAECLEAESLDDRDYYIDEPTLALLQDRHAEPALIEMLRRALGTREGMDVRWARSRMV